ncbi:MAG: hypothetical protein ABIG69_17565 [Bacteroidota bacterium]
MNTEGLISKLSKYGFVEEENSNSSWLLLTRPNSTNFPESKLVLMVKQGEKYAGKFNPDIQKNDGHYLGCLSSGEEIANYIKEYYKKDYILQRAA